MKLIGYRFKSHEEECWAYTYDLKGVRRGKGIKEYGYVEPIYVDDERNYVQVEVPKVPRFISDVLDRYKTRDYNSFKARVKYDITLLISEQYKWTFNNRKTIDLAIALGVWEIEDEQRN